VQKLLLSYPDLVSQFAAFLLPEQAADCNCFIDNLLFTKADRCISELQVNFRASRTLLLNLNVVELNISSANLSLREVSDQYLSSKA